MFKKFCIISSICILCGFALFAQAQSIAYPKVNKIAFGKIIDTIKPVVVGEVSTYLIKPGLPHNLALDPVKGTIAGTVNEILVDSSYTITAKDKTGKTLSFPLVIKTIPPLSNGSPASPVTPPGAESPNFALGWTIFLCLILMVFIVVAAFRSQVLKKEALGFPRGSIRSIIAILFVIFFVLLSVIFYFDSGPGSVHSQDLAKQILTILGTLVTAVSAFYFGAKATEQGHVMAAETFQSLSNQLAGAQNSGPATNQNSTQLTMAQIAQLAIQQNQGKLRGQFKNILSLSDAVNNQQGNQTHVVAIYLTDGNIAGLPNTLTASLSDGSSQNIPTQIIPNLGAGSIQIAQINDVTSDVNSIDYTGCICCLVKSTTNPAFLGVVTSGHILSNGEIKSVGGIISPPQSGAEINKSLAGKWFYQTIDSAQDLAIIQLDSNVNNDAQYHSFSNGYYTIDDVDVKTTAPNVTIISKNKQTDAYVIDYNLAFDVPYAHGSNYMSGIILLGSNPDPDQSQCVSQPGDSGSCVFHKATGKLIGMILGGNLKFSYVLTISDTLNNFNFKPV